MIRIFTDGGARGNPGPAAWAFVVYHYETEVFNNSGFIGDSTNNIAEYTALLEATTWLKINIHNYGDEKVNYYLDSELVVKQMQGVYKIKNKNLITLALKIKKVLSETNCKVVFTHIPRSQNKLADHILNETLDENLG